MEDLKSTKFGVHSGDISDFTHIAKLNFCHAYRVNCFKGQVENQYVARLNIREVPFGG